MGGCITNTLRNDTNLFMGDMLKDISALYTKRDNKANASFVALSRIVGVWGEKDINNNTKNSSNLCNACCFLMLLLVD